MKEQEKELGLAEGELQQLIQASADAERKLATTDSSYDVTLGEIESLNQELDESLFDTESVFGISAEDLTQLTATQDETPTEEPTAVTEPEAIGPKEPIVTDDGIMLPRLDIRVGDSETGKLATELSDYGFTKLEDGTYQSSTEKTYTADEINDYFRELEEDATGIDTKWRNKADKLGIEITDGMTSEQLEL